MSYQDEIAKIQQDLRVELYTITIGDEDLFITNHVEPVTLGNDVYINKPIRGDGTEQEIQFDSEEMQLTIPILPFVVDYIENGPIEKVTVNVLDYFVGSGNFINVFSGTMGDITIELDTGIATLNVQSGDSVMNAVFPSIPFKARCPFQTYDVRCGLNRDNFKEEGSATTTSNGFILESSTLDDQDDGYFTNGFVFYTRGNKTQKRWITNHIGNQATILYPFRDFVDGATLQFFAGDDKSFETCRDKFSNEIRWSGFKRIPNKNPVTTGV